MDKADVLHRHNRILCISKKWELIVHWNMDRIGGHHVKWNISVREGQIQSAVTYCRKYIGTGITEQW